MATGSFAQRHDWKRTATLAAIALGILALLAGIAAWGMSLRPLRFRVEPGQLASWTLITTWSELGADGRPGPERSEQRTIVLIGIGEGNEAALLAEPLRQAEGISLLRFDPTGSATLLDAAARPMDGGRSVGLFDFNLMPLPPGSEQSWWTPVSWSAVPPAKRTVQARVRRMRTGATGGHSDILLRLPTSIEWIERGAYRQLRDVQVSYRFATSRHLVEEAEIRLVTGYETAGAPRRFAVYMRLHLNDDRDLGDPPERLRAAALACAEAQEVLRSGDPARAPAVIDRLRGSEAGEPRLRSIARELTVSLEAMRRHPAAGVAPAASWALLAASGPEQERVRAERLVHLLTAQGFPAWLQSGANRQLRILVGPFATRNEDEMRRLAACFPYLRPTWTSVR